MTTVPANETPQPTNTPRINPWLVRVPLLMLLGGMLLGMTMLVLLAGYMISMNGRIAPGVSAAGVPLGGMTTASAAAALDEAFTYDEETVFTLRHDEQFWQVTAGELGVSLDAEATAASALTASHADNPLSGLAQQTETWFSGQMVQPVVRYDETAARAQLNAIADEVTRPPQDATLTINGLNVETTPGQPGTVLDVDAALATLSEQLTTLQPGGEIQLQVRQAAPQVTDVESTAAYVRAALSAPLQLIATDADGNPLGPWTVPPDTIAAALQVERNTAGDGPAYDVTVDFSGFAPQLETLAPGLIVPARNGRFTYNEQNGQLEALVAAVNGRRLDVDATIQRMEAAVFDPDSRTVELAYTYRRPQYHNDLTAAELGITERISSSRTLFTGSTAARRTNIENAAGFYNGVIVAPDEVFSFNQIVGDITEENGFVEGAIIFGGRTVNGIGGGVCQVSTTIYRAAFTGGFPIVERYSHGYRVGYYELGNAPPGLDAAIYVPTADFKFRNDTGNHILIETEFMPDLNALEFRIYGTNPGRTVEVSEPTIRNVTEPPPTIYEVNEDLQPGQQLQVDWAKSGGDVVITRTIRDAETGDVLERRDYATFYQPWAAVVQVPPGDERLS